MAEISREEAIKKMRLMKYCEIEMPLLKHIAICEQAISDMEKMQKIEEILSKNAKKYCGSCSNYGETCYGDSEEIEKCKYVDIEQIVKEVG